MFLCWTLTQRHFQSVLWVCPSICTAILNYITQPLVLMDEQKHEAPICGESCNLRADLVVPSSLNPRSSFYKPNYTAKREMSPAQYVLVSSTICTGHVTRSYSFQYVPEYVCVCVCAKGDKQVGFKLVEILSSQCRSTFWN